LKADLSEFKERLEKLLEALREAEKLFDEGRSYFVEFCVDCGRVYEESEFEEHLNHTRTFTCVDHDGIGEWIACLQWVLQHLE
jgi:ribulose 1,5-bisphosphate carboxylase large subunit-like protein